MSTINWKKVQAEILRGATCKELARKYSVWDARSDDPDHRWRALETNARRRGELKAWRR